MSREKGGARRLYPKLERAKLVLCTGFYSCCHVSATYLAAAVS